VLRAGLGVTWYSLSCALPPLRPKRSAYGVAGLRSGRGQVSSLAWIKPNTPTEELLARAIPLNYQIDFCRTSGKRSGLLPVRFGQRAHAPAFGRSLSSCGSKGAFVRSRWISRSILISPHPRNPLDHFPGDDYASTIQVRLCSEEALNWGAGLFSCICAASEPEFLPKIAYPIFGG